MQPLVRTIGVDKSRLLKGVTTVAVPALSESELREALEALEKYKGLGLKSSRFDPELNSGKTISFQKNDNENEWILK